MTTNYNTRTVPTSSYTERTSVQIFDYITWDEATFTWDSTLLTWDNAYSWITSGTSYTERTPI